MNPLRKLKTFGFGILTLSCSIILVSGCTNNANVQPPSQQDVQLASNIIGESMSNDGGGLVSSFGDATSMVSSTGLSYSQYGNLNNVPTVSSMMDDSLRGREKNFRATYDPATGTHTVDFNREVNTKNFSKTVKAHLEYIYRDSTGKFLRFPIPTQVFSVDFKGSRSGSVQTPNKKSDFSRIDTLFYTGLNRSSSSITINGSHQGHGDFELTNNTTQISKVYDLNLKLLNVNIEKSSIINRDLTQGVTGTLSYDLTFHKSQDTTAVDKHITGTIDMNGDGTALLKFAHFTNRYLINLKTGAASINQ